jgi:hypothetical protein
MSLFKKLFKKETPKETISRAVRVALSPLHRILFHRKTDTSVQEEKVGNVSKTGMGIVYHPGLDALSPGIRVTGELELDGKGFEVEAEVRHITRNILGCRFIGEPTELALAVQEYLRGEILGLSLQPVGVENLAQPDEGTPEWYTDGDNNELYFVKSPEGILSFHITFLGSYLEGGVDKKLRFGYIVNEGEGESVLYKGSNLIHFEPEIPGGTDELAATIIQNVSDLSLQNRNRLLKFLEKIKDQS